MSNLIADLSPTERAKYTTAYHAAQMVENGMKVGLGTGSTAAWLVKILGKRVRDEGLEFVGVPTSTRTAELAREVGITLSTLDDLGWLDLTIDGADEFDPDFNLIKGGGGAHLQEQIVASASDKMVVIADANKEVQTLGAFKLPVEVIPFGMRSTQTQIEKLLNGQDVDGRSTALRMNGDQPFVSDEGNYIIDLDLKRIGNAVELSNALNQIAGVVENGLFIDICDAVVVGHPDGRVTEMRKGEPAIEAQVDLDGASV